MNALNWAGFRCFHCHRPLAISYHGFCSYCTKQIKRTAYCAGCGMPLAENSTFQTTCGYCLKNEMKWHRTIQVGCYQEPLSNWIWQFKYQQKFFLDFPLARLLLLAIKEAQRQRYIPLPEAILPVPLFWQRHWQRGYNQAELIARHLSKWLKIPLDETSLQRIRPTPAQQGLTATVRRKNLRKAFYYCPLKPYQRLAIVDDVVTTGSTLNTICTELLKAGVQEIQVWTLARA